MPTTLLTLTLLAATLQQQTPPNILLIIADDLGTDHVGWYDEEPESPHEKTPNLDALAASGLTFTNAYSEPVCSPTRTSIMTGLTPADHLIGTPVWWNSEENQFGGAFVPTQLFLPTFAPPEYRRGFVGKLHFDHDPGLREQFPAITRGWEDYRGAPDGVLTEAVDGSGGMDSYTDYTHFTVTANSTVTEQSHVYATTSEVHDALEMIKDFGQDPWFVTLAFHAPHPPPTTCHHPGCTRTRTSTRRAPTQTSTVPPSRPWTGRSGACSRRSREAVAPR